MSMGPLSENTNLYAELREKIVAAHLLEKTPFFYIFAGILILVLSGTGFWLIAGSHSLVLKLLGILLLAFTTVQGGLWGHDLAHHQVLSAEKFYVFAGILCWNLLLGLSFGYWNYKHNRHHAHPNTIGEDGDIRFPVLWFNQDLANGIGTLKRRLLPYQKYYFLPLLVFPYFVQMRHSAVYMVKQKERRYFIELVLFLLHHTIIWFVFFYFIPAPYSTLFLILYYVLMGIYMGVIFSPNHYGMPVLKKDNDLDYVHEQVSTTRNINPHFINNVLYGGLNYQIEHHLFPTMPRSKLKSARKIVMAFCAEHQIPYHETSTAQAFREIFSQLDSVARSPVRYL